MTRTDGDPALDEVVALLDLEGSGDTWAGEHSALAIDSGHVFGGLVAAQATVAAHRTVDAEWAMHSLHAYFLHRGDPAVPVEYRVERTREGRSFTHRRVSAVQHGRPIMQLASSFAVAEPGLAHQESMPAVPGPDELEPDLQPVTRFGPFELRSVGTRTWFRAHRPLPSDPVLHRALLVYASDMTVLEPTTRPAGLSMSAGDVQPTTLDHAVWFHRQTRVDEWFLIDADSPWAGAGRGLARGRVFDPRGVMTAEIAQEALIRTSPG